MATPSSPSPNAWAAQARTYVSGEPGRSVVLLTLGLFVIALWLIQAPVRALPPVVVLDVPAAPGPAGTHDMGHGAEEDHGPGDHHDPGHAPAVLHGEDHHGPAPGAHAKAPNASDPHQGGDHDAGDHDARDHNARDQNEGDHAAHGPVLAAADPGAHGSDTHGSDPHSAQPQDLDTHGSNGAHGPADPFRAPVPDADLMDGALAPAPDVGLIEEAAHGFLPRIGADGRRPDAVYARPFFDPHDRPKIAIVIRDLGLGAQASQEAVDGLPPEISLAISPYAAQPQLWTNQARARGHEVLLDLPMEPYGYPAHDPGPYALLTRLPAPERTVRLHRLMASTTGYTGILTRHGRAFLKSEDDLAPILKDVAGRGLFFLEDGSAERSLVDPLAQKLGRALPRGTVDRPLDQRPSRRNVDLALLELEALARTKGRAIGVGTALPVTVARIRAWASTLDAKGLVLAPVSAMMMRPRSPKGVRHAALAEP